MKKPDELGYSANTGGEAAVKRPSPPPFLIDEINPYSSIVSLVG